MSELLEIQRLDYVLYTNVSFAPEVLLVFFIRRHKNFFLASIHDPLMQ